MVWLYIFCRKFCPGCLEIRNQVGPFCQCLTAVEKVGKIHYVTLYSSTSATSHPKQTQYIVGVKTEHMFHCVSSTYGWDFKSLEATWCWFEVEMEPQSLYPPFLNEERCDLTRTNGFPCNLWNKVLGAWWCFTFFVFSDPKHQKAWQCIFRGQFSQGGISAFCSTYTTHILCIYSLIHTSLLLSLNLKRRWYAKQLLASLGRLHLAVFSGIYSCVIVHKQQHYTFLYHRSTLGIFALWVLCCRSFLL